MSASRFDDAIGWGLKDIFLCVGNFNSGVFDDDFWR